MRKSIEIRLTNTNRTSRLELLDDSRLDWRLKILEHFRRRSSWCAERQVIILDHKRYARQDARILTFFDPLVDLVSSLQSALCRQTEQRMIFLGFLGFGERPLDLCPRSGLAFFNPIY